MNKQFQTIIHAHELNKLQKLKKQNTSPMVAFSLKSASREVKECIN